MLGGEEGVKYPVEVFGRYATAGIDDVNNDKFAGLDGVGAKLVRFCQCFNMGIDIDGAVSVHGVFGIDGKVEDNLRELGRIDPDEAQFVAVVKFEDNLFAQNPFEHQAQLGKLFGDVD